MIENSRQNHRLRGLSDFTDSLALRVLRAGARISFLATLIFALPAFASTPLLNLRQAPSVEEESYQKEISESLHLTDQTQNDAAGVRVAKNGGALSLTINQNYSEKANKAYKHIFVGTQRLVTKLVGNNPKKLEDAQWYYHGDHLSSSSYVTNADGAIVEHLSYFPYGETWVQEKDSLPINYGFTAKELDEETGYYYFGARYYDPRVSTWVSTDPALGEYVDGGQDGLGGVHNSVNQNVYHYAGLNPLKLVDPDGEKIKQNQFAGSTALLRALSPTFNKLYQRIEQNQNFEGSILETTSNQESAYQFLEVALGDKPGSTKGVTYATDASGKPMIRRDNPNKIAGGEANVMTGRLGKGSASKEADTMGTLVHEVAHLGQFEAASKGKNPRLSSMPSNRSNELAVNKLSSTILGEASKNFGKKFPKGENIFKEALSKQTNIGKVPND